GLPKAAIVSHGRLMQWTHWFAGLLDTGPGDRMYNCLPMYHSIGGVVAMGATLVNGGSVVVRERFSVSRFWDEVVDWDCTLFQYIGELCRFLVNSPPHPRERDHRLRLCAGNGLRADVWEALQQRFGIPRILEFYAATEANFSLYNCEGKPGAIGRVPSFLAHRFPLALIRVNAATQEPVRDAAGLCCRCETNEAGEAISAIVDADAAGGSRFEGYTDASASERKVLRNVFRVGDAWFRSGDLMRRDEAGFYYFVDRLGDTFRWKGENVSTAEVAEVVARCAGVDGAVVYGVPVPGAEGRAGMAAITVADGFDLGFFREHLAERLPPYARPLFVRVLSNLEMTGTFKPLKHELAEAGFDPGQTTDPIYFHDRDREAFVRLDAALFDRIQIGGIRL
ncbi:MAG TPA: AMP-binding protein, partial [Gemmatimonadaceae bacterium]|nr:AMP-binding protein [Gemmatimonadaceae bacterium]